MLGFMGMGVEEPPAEEELNEPKMSVKRMKKEKKRQALQRQKEKEKVQGLKSEKEVDEEAKREAEFARFLQGVGGELVLFPLLLRGYGCFG